MRLSEIFRFVPSVSNKAQSMKVEAHDDTMDISWEKPPNNAPASSELHWLTVVSNSSGCVVGVVHYKGTQSKVSTSLRELYMIKNLPLLLFFTLNIIIYYYSEIIQSNPYSGTDSMRET